MTSSDCSSLHQLLAGLTFFAGTAIAVLAMTLGSDPLTGIIVLGGSSLVAWSIAAQGERWRVGGRTCATRRR